MCRANFKGVWTLVALLLVVYFIGFNLDFNDYITSRLNVPETEGNSPLYFLRLIFVQGVSAGVAAFLGVSLALLTWRRCQPFSGMCLWMSWLWNMPRVAEAALIYWRCPFLLDPNRAVSAWPRMHDYLSDPYRQAAFWGTLACTAPFVIVSLRSAAAMGQLRTWPGSIRAADRMSHPCNVRVKLLPCASQSCPISTATGRPSRPCLRT